MTLAITLRTLIITINVVALVVIAGVVAFRVLSVRRQPTEKTPENREPLPDDETMEGRKLERVLRWALLFSVLVAVALPLYWLWEPFRQEAQAEGFDERAVERGEVLYADATMEAYDSARSLACATCHGSDGSGGSAPFVLTPDAQGDPEAAPVQVSWAAPALDTVLRRFTEEQVSNILIYGRPGTPMPAWGLAGGGPKNDQAISDLVAYLKSIQLSEKGAKRQSNEAVEALRDRAETFVPTTLANIESARQALAAAEERLAAAETADQREVAQRLVALREEELATAQSALPNAQAAEETIRNASEGELLFMTNCARCHTEGWSYWDPTNGNVPLPEPQGSGAFGPSLRDGATLIQFPGEPGREKMYDWVAVGAPANKPYGVRGISSGQMSYFQQVLTEDQINAIIDYERGL